MSVKEQQIVDLNQKINRLYAIICRLSEYVGWQDLENLALGLNDSCGMDENKPLIPVKLEPTLAELPDEVSDWGHNYSKITDAPKESESTEDNWQEVASMMRDGHKDILSDTNPDSEHHSFSDCFYHEDNNVSCEDKLQRLTAQLTAAYNRIAHLEEQLLAHRQQTETRQHGFHFNH